MAILMDWQLSSYWSIDDDGSFDTLNDANADAAAHDGDGDSIGNYW